MQSGLYDRMSRKDFSRKSNSFAPVLINDSYSKFRFTKRASDQVSPLSQSRFGLSKNPYMLSESKMGSGYLRSSQSAMRHTKMSLVSHKVDPLFSSSNELRCNTSGEIITPEDAV